MLDMEPPNETQFHNCLGAEEFIEPVWLAGWDDQSSWGAEFGRFFLQLRRNGDPHDEPPYLWISPASREPLLHPGSVALEVTLATGADSLSAAQALQILPPPPPPEHNIAAIAEDQLYAALQEPNSIDKLGLISVYDWALGRRKICPGSGQSWPSDLAPTYQQVAAELHINIGWLCELMDGRQEYRLGVDTALRTLLWPPP